MTDRDAASPQLLAADLVVDTSGRTSRTPEWLERRGYAAPVEDVRRIDKQYATRTFRRTSDPGQPVVRIAAARPGFPRGGIMLACEGDVWMVSLSGRDGEQPPLELEEYRAWARTLATAELADALDALEPLDEGVRYRFPANRRRHYERMTAFPSGLVVTGRRPVRVRPRARSGDDGRGGRGGGARRRAGPRRHRRHRPAVPPPGRVGHRHALDHRGGSSHQTAGFRPAAAWWTATWPAWSGQPRTIRSSPPRSCG